MTNDDLSMIPGEGLYSGYLDPNAFTAMKATVSGCSAWFGDIWFRDIWFGDICSRFGTSGAPPE